MKLILILLIVLSTGCILDNDSESDPIVFGQPQQVTVPGYTGDIMEAFLSGDGQILFFNNLNHPSVNTNLHYATKINDTTFESLPF